MGNGLAACSASLNADSWKLSCVIVGSAPIVEKFLIDTGACNTVITEGLQSVLRLEETGATMIFHSVSGQSIKAYQVQTTQMTIGTVDIGKQKLWVVPGIHGFIGVIGVDLLRKVMFMKISDNNKLIVSGTAPKFLTPVERALYLVCTAAGIEYEEAIKVLPDCWRQLAFETVIVDVLQMKK